LHFRKNTNYLKIRIHYLYYNEKVMMMAHVVNNVEVTPRAILNFFLGAEFGAYVVRP
jgi:hypothetical protein